MGLAHGYRSMRESQDGFQEGQDGAKEARMEAKIGSKWPSWGQDGLRLASTIPSWDRKKHKDGTKIGLQSNPEKLVNKDSLNYPPK